jgi:hypothetical protein
MNGVSHRKNKKDCEESLLLWAIRDLEKKHVHVGMLAPTENGLACRCRCLSCGENLRAINADKPAAHFEKPGTQRRHFKHHHSSSGESRCLSAAAQRVALQLFVEQGTIFLPTRHRTVSRLSPVGVLVEARQEISTELVQVKSRIWIDDLSTLLRLEDGRELLVTIRTHHQVRDDCGVACVLSLAGVRDPAIAGWDSDKILQHLGLPDCGIEWGRHWDDAELDANKENDLAEQEALYLGGIPQEWLEKLDGKQINETILHWLIKKTVAKSKILRVPEFSIPVCQQMPDGLTAEETAFCGESVLQLDDIRLERRFDVMVPDVMCRARKIGFNGPIFDLIIEAAVTNYLGDEKREKIRLSGVACIQIRADLFAQAGTVHVSEIERIILADTSVKEWVVHPWIAAEIAKAKKRLESQAKRILDEMEVKAAAERLRQEVESQRLINRHILLSWLSDASDVAVARGYLKVLRASWFGSPRCKIGNELVDISDLRKELVHREIIGVPHWRVEPKGELLSILDRIKYESPNPESGCLVDLLVQAVEVDDRVITGNAVMIMFALERYKPIMTALQAQIFQTYCARLRVSVKKCDERFCRSTKHDRLYALLFPEMTSDLETDYATRSYMVRINQERESNEIREKCRHERRRIRLMLAAELRNKKEQRELAKAIEQEQEMVAGQFCWLGASGMTPAALYGWYGAKIRFEEISAMDIFKIAIRHREMKKNVVSAIKAMPFRHAADVPAAINLLLLAGLCARLRA